MEQRRWLEEDGYCLDLYQGEIPVRGVGLMTVQDCKPGQWTRAFAHGVELLRQQGAQMILASSPLEGSPLRGKTAQVGPLRFVYRHTLDLLILDIQKDRWGPCDSLIHEPLSRDNAEEFIRLYNDAMDLVPNVTTYTMEDLPQLMSLRQMAQLYRLPDGTPAAVTEVQLGMDRPLLETLAVAEDYRGRGLGRAALGDTLCRLYRGGYWGVALIVSNANPTAYRFYLSQGFQKYRAYSHWYEFQGE